MKLRRKLIPKTAHEIHRNRPTQKHLHTLKTYLPNQVYVGCLDVLNHSSIKKRFGSRDLLNFPLANTVTFKQFGC